MLAALLLWMAASPDSRVVTSPPLIRLAPPVPPFRTPADNATPLGAPNLLSLFTTDDYPVSAIRAGQEGTVEVRLLVTVEGRVDRCEILSSSGSATLDLATCNILTRRARFRPALDRFGQATVDHITQKVRWVLPRQPLAAITDRSTISYGANGQILSCIYLSTDQDAARPSCQQIDSLVRRMLNSSDLGERLTDRTMMFEHRLQPGTTPSIPRPSDRRERLLWFQRAEYELSSEGAVVRCTIVESQGGSFGDDLCTAPLDGPFEKANDGGRRFFQATAALVSRQTR